MEIAYAHFVGRPFYLVWLRAPRFVGAAFWLVGPESFGSGLDQYGQIVVTLARSTPDELRDQLGVFSGIIGPNDHAAATDRAYRRELFDHAHVRRHKAGAIARGPACNRLHAASHFQQVSSLHSWPARGIRENHFQLFVRLPT